MKSSTRCVHLEANGDPYNAISPPIYQTATFGQQDASKFGEYDYSRTANPTRKLVEQQLAALEDGNYACAFASGMAAITALTRTLEIGDHIVVGNDLYGGTVRFLGQVLSRSGICVSYVDTTDVDAVRACLNPKTRLVLIETPTNPFLRIVAIEALAELAHSIGAILAVDNSMLSPCFQQPLALGADVVIHSATKFLCGHSDVTGGVVVTNDYALHERVAFQQNAEGAGLSPFDSWLLLRGIKTLFLRAERQTASAQTIAEFLSDHLAIEQVYYPGLRTHADYELHQRQATGAGAVISFKTGDANLAQRVVSNTKLFTIAVSFGSVNSVISIPHAMSHASIPGSLKQSLAPPPDLIRLSIGIEDVNDLVDDLQQAFAIATRGAGGNNGQLALGCHPPGNAANGDTR